MPKFVWRFLCPWARHLTLVVPRFGGHVKPSRRVGPVYMYLTLIQACTLTNVTGYSKRARNQPGTVDCTSKLHSSTLGSTVRGKGDCDPFESPLRRSNLGPLQSMQYIYRYRCHTINLSLTSERIPDAWKLSRIVPVFKAGDPHTVTNYRPILLNPSAVNCWKESSIIKPFAIWNPMEFQQIVNLLFSYQNHLLQTPSPLLSMTGTVV